MINLFGWMSGAGSSKSNRPATAAELTAVEKNIVMKLSELKGQLDAVHDQLVKAQGEITTEFWEWAV